MIKIYEKMELQAFEAMLIDEHKFKEYLLKETGEIYSLISLFFML